MPIEQLWEELRRQGGGAQLRVDAAHPVDLYADYQLPVRPGLVVFTEQRPPQTPPYQAIDTETGRRPDGKWSLRLTLTEPGLLPIFTQLCADIIQFTRTGVDPARAGGPILARMERWHNLLRSLSGQLGDAALKGLIGELHILSVELLPALGLDDAIASWTGPIGTPQDFQLPNGTRLEVKTTGVNASEVTINGLDQLDAGTECLQLLIVRTETTGRDAADAVSAVDLVQHVRATIDDAPLARATFEQRLLFIGWDDARDNDRIRVRIIRTDRHEVNDRFPRLTAANVPAGIVDATYRISLPAGLPP